MSHSCQDYITFQMLLKPHYSIMRCSLFAHTYFQKGTSPKIISTQGLNTVSLNRPSFTSVLLTHLPLFSGCVSVGQSLGLSVRHNGPDLNSYWMNLVQTVIVPRGLIPIRIYHGRWVMLKKIIKTKMKIKNALKWIKKWKTKK